MHFLSSRLYHDNKRSLSFFIITPEKKRPEKVYIIPFTQNSGAVISGSELKSIY
jgi:hypothetical protein